MPASFAPRRAVPVVDPVDAAPDAFAASEPLRLPDAWTPSPRPPLPLIASLVPVVGAVVLWLVTGSILALLLAALGPLIAVAGVVDGRRGARRERLRAEQVAVTERSRVSRAIGERHDHERDVLRARHPDVAGYLGRDAEVWRRTPARDDALVVGTGDVASSVRVSGGEGDAQAARLRARAARLPHGPVVVPASAGIAVIGGGAVAAAVHRALVLQHCLAVPPGDVRIMGAVPADMAFVDALPHRHAASARGLAVAPLLDAGDPTVLIVRAAADEPLPPGCGAVLRVVSPRHAVLDYAGSLREVAVEAVSIEQATAIADDLALRAERALGFVRGDEEPVRFADVSGAATSPPGGLSSAIGVGGGETVVIDLVADGPHAVVAGMTGAGKSELLVTWIAGLAAVHSTREVSFLLADFKGGTAFDGLRDLPHVTGVITDLDGAGARRAIESLRAEVRWREGELARAGARDILDPRVDLPRLVVVVDEFAALLGDHPELHAVFGDVAARGRALGMHLVLGTQRVVGVVRDGLLANCPLRISLRVTDASDSRAVVGCEDAALLPGTAAGRGLALVRRSGDATARRVRIALCSADDIAAIAGRDAGPPPRRPWLPALAQRVALDELRSLPAHDRPADGFLIGLADEPEQQRQRAIGVSIRDRGLLVVGGAGAGKSCALETIAHQASRVIRIPTTAEGTWDAVERLAEHPPRPGTVIVADDLDMIVSRLPAEHAHVVLERLEHVLRGAGDAGILVVASAQRITGPAGRLVDLLPRRLLLGMPTRADHLSAGGDGAHFAPDAPAGRGRLGGIAVQVALPDRRDAARDAERSPDTPEWSPQARLTGLVTRRRAAVRPALEAWAMRGVRALTIEEYLSDPSSTADGPVVVVGDPDDWQREWRLLASVRADHDLVIDAACSAEYRLLTASRTLPPFARTGAGRAWLHEAGGDAVRIVLPGVDVRPERRARPLTGRDA